MILGEHGGVVLAADAGFNSETGERDELTLAAYRVGPRGGHRYVFHGSAEELDEQIALLHALRAAVPQVPQRIAR